VNVGQQRIRASQVLVKCVLSADALCLRAVRKLIAGIVEGLRRMRGFDGAISSANLAKVFWCADGERCNVVATVPVNPRPSTFRREVDPMKPEQLAEALETAASQLGVKVRYETLTTTGPTGGWLVQGEGEWFIIIDRKTAVSERVSILGEALATMDTEHIYLPPRCATC